MIRHLQLQHTEKRFNITHFGLENLGCLTLSIFSSSKYFIVYFFRKTGKGKGKGGKHGKGKGKGCKK